MSTAIAERVTADVLPKEQLDLIRRTVANGASNDELALFLYDCQRRGIHPLDKLLHFTKRGGKYTPVTSIDFMRSQAAMSGEMAGSDDATFLTEFDERGRPDAGRPPLAATVTVYRITGGQRFAYTATARWSEYCPDNAQMWKRMPYTMLAKCAEALALRKAFPQQLAGLYAKEELDQAERTEQYIIEAPAAPPAIPAAREGTAENRVGRAVEGIGQTTRVLVAGNEHAKDGDPVYAEVDLHADEVLDGFAPERVPTPDLPPGVVMITRVKGPMGKAKGFVIHSGMDPHVSSGSGLAMYDDKLAAFAEQCCEKLTPVRLKTKTSAAGNAYITALEPVDLDAPF